jgi:aminopeptidase N
MYAALHDLLGDATFRRFLHAYFAEWSFRHVDRWAMQGVAERVSGQSLGWFFDQWVNTVGVVEYAIGEARSVQEGTQWRTTVRLTRRGAYRHAMPLGVRVDGVWTIVRGDPLKDDAELSIVTAQKPDAVWLDPFGATDAVGAMQGRIELR